MTTTRKQVQPEVQGQSGAVEAIRGGADAERVEDAGTAPQEPEPQR